LGTVIGRRSSSGRSRPMPQRVIERTHVLLASAARFSITYVIEEKYGYMRNAVRRWIDRYEADGLAKYQSRSSAE
jgi:hypothetical protein